MDETATNFERPLTGTVRDIRNLEIIRVCKTPMEATWNYLMRTYHYLGYTNTIGQRIKYLIFSEGFPIAAISYNRAALHVEARDKYIGWDDNQRKSMLHCIVNNNRFLILPWVAVRNLSSYLLSQTMKLLKIDWKETYGVSPCLAETFIDLQRHAGTCYRAANWLPIGETKGFGKVGKAFVYHGNRKGVFVFPIQRNWIAQVRNASVHQPSKNDAEEEAVLMVLQQMDWHPGLMEEAGITPENVFTLAFRLQSFMKSFDECFGHAAQRFNSNIYVKGLLSDLERKSAEPMALRYAGPAGVRNLQYFSQKGAWDEGMMSQIYKEKVSRIIADPENGMITLDGSDMPKKGGESVGVARQHCGSLGKVENCQAGVFLGYTGANGYALVEGRLYMPEVWFTDEYKERRIKCGVPKDIKFQTKIEIASDMLHEAHGSGLFPARWVGADGTFGSSHNFLDGVPEGLTYFADIPCDTLVFRDMPEVGVPPYSGKGRKPVLPKPSFPPVSVKSIAEDESMPFERVQLGMGSKGPVVADVKCVRIIRAKDKLPHHGAWLYIRRLADGELKFSLCNAATDCPRETMDSAALMRWPIEQSFEECKTNLGMDHCEARSWNSFHRHLLLVFISALFLLIIRNIFCKKNCFDSAASPASFEGCSYC